MSSQQKLLDDCGLTDVEFSSLLEAAEGNKYVPFDFVDPVEMLHAIDPRIAAGTFKLHDWQVRALKLFSFKKYYTKDTPFRFLLRASNGSGKDSYFIAAAAVWQAITSPRSRFIITSSSFNQLKNQTEPGIRAIARMLNEWAGEEVVYIKQFHMVAKNTHAEILLFVTDEAGLAEGYHPFPDYVDAEMTLCVNEAKSVKDEIFGALKRCNGYNRWVEVSSPGGMSGHFYQTDKESTRYPAKYIPGVTSYYSMKITSYDCPHISNAVIEQDKKDLGGEHTPLFRSMHLAEFTSLDEDVVIPMEFLIRCLDRNIPKQRGINRVGGDLSAGGDETVLILVNGNTIMEMWVVRITDTTILAEMIDAKLKEWKARYGDLPEISMDDGNVGKSIIDMLKRKGWTQIKRVWNQSPALNKTRFVNRGAEMWWLVRDIIEKCLVCFAFRDGKLLEQLHSRYYETSLMSKIKLESKADARSNGHGSPDRGDALVLCFNGYDTTTFEEEFGSVKNVSINPDGPKNRRYSSLQEVADAFENGEIVRNKPRVTKQIHQTIRSLFGISKGSL